jgi:hypothetical protein
MVDPLLPRIKASDMELFEPVPGQSKRQPTLNMIVRRTLSRIAQPPHAEMAAIPHGRPPTIARMSATIHAVLTIQRRTHLSTRTGGSPLEWGYC